MRVIIRDVEPEDFILAIRAVRWLMERVTKDAIMSYGEDGKARDFYVRRNKSSITVRPCNRPPPSAQRKLQP
jgi:hypothetical protein